MDHTIHLEYLQICFQNLHPSLPLSRFGYMPLQLSLFFSFGTIFASVHNNVLNRNIITRNALLKIYGKTDKRMVHHMFKISNSIDPKMPHHSFNICL